jgi:hypothetical protein
VSTHHLCPPFFISTLDIRATPSHTTVPFFVPCDTCFLPFHIYCLTFLLRVTVSAMPLHSSFHPLPSFLIQTSRTRAYSSLIALPCASDNALLVIPSRKMNIYACPYIVMAGNNLSSQPSIVHHLLRLSCLYLLLRRSSHIPTRIDCCLS